jgi:hypothetical protein
MLFQWLATPPFCRAASGPSLTPAHSCLLTMSLIAARKSASSAGVQACVSHHGGRRTVGFLGPVSASFFSSVRLRLGMAK